MHSYPIFVLYYPEYYIYYIYRIVSSYMQVLPFTIPKPKPDALILQEDKEQSFYNLLHQHQEFQISLIISGEGALIVGDTINYYKAGDLIVLGSNLPHVFKSALSKSTESHMLTVFFSKESFGHDFFNIEELKSLQFFFKKAENGFKIVSKKSNVFLLFKQFFKASKLDRFILFFTLLKSINQSEYVTLSNFISSKKYSDNEGRRMSAVFEYTMSNFQREITLTDIAKEASMTKNAFCKYFKKRTNKTYVTFLNELRIEESCKLLRSRKELSIAEIAMLSGFQNISNFNRKFKLGKHKIPSEYRKQDML